MTSGNKSLAVLAACLALFVTLSVRRHSTQQSAQVVAVPAAKATFPALPPQAPSVDDATKSKMRETLAKVPMSFESTAAKRRNKFNPLPRPGLHSLPHSRCRCLALPVPPSNPPKSQTQVSSSAPIRCSRGVDPTCQLAAPAPPSATKLYSTCAS